MTIKELDEKLEETESLKAIAQAYSEIANLKVKRIRSKVEKNRAFFQEISKVYALVKKFAVTKKLNLVKPRKTISIVLTSNHGFYGSINTDLLRFFVNKTNTFPTDKIVVNKTGIDYLRAQSGISNYQEVLLKDDQPSANELTFLVSLLKDYNQVLVFFPTMKSLLVQQPTIADITASNVSSTGGLNNAPTQENENFKFIFEPELPKILQFFDSQVTTLLLEETFLEAELSRTASRFVSMDEAENESNKSIKQYQILRTYAKRNIDNNTILETFATMKAVRRGREL